MTIKEIAAATGVSPTTVANVVHERRERMSDETYRKVKEALFFKSGWEEAERLRHRNDSGSDQQWEQGHAERVFVAVL